ncbi:MAG: putative peptidoglycan glycosyltransferase FtsW [Coriobacteriaceae bacterium]|nr:putative peptidoglycan glycosyltransferase FtsW [Coriobacteriaceae bacterium]
MKDRKTEQERAGRPRRRRATATSHSDMGEKYIAGVPARIMRPRLVFIVLLCALCAFGLLMVYSASSAEALELFGDSTYYLKRQAIFMAAGFALLMLIASPKIIPWGAVRTLLPKALWFITLALLVYVLGFGSGGDDWGASRWIGVGFFSLQPAEFAKPVVIVLIAKIFADYYEERSIDTRKFVINLLVCVGLTCFLIYKEPDMGTALIIAATVFLMLYLSGLSNRAALLIIVLGVVALIVGTVAKDYRFERFLIQQDPWKDPFDKGYQTTMAIMAFASGGLFGRGIGNATLKYQYIPEAHNDFIFAVIGEEIGWIGSMIFVVVFIALFLAAMRIARQAPTYHARIMASGCSLILIVQFFVNIFGITNLFMMTGKPIPFVSYGGSSIITSLILAGIILRVSRESNVETVADRRRADMAVLGGVRDRAGRASMTNADERSTHVGRSTAGEPRRRSAEGAPTLSVYDGGLSSPSGRVDSARAVRSGDTRGSRARTVSLSGSSASSGYERVNLGRGAQERLRSQDSSPRVNDQRGAHPRTSEGPRRGRTSRGERHGRS